jgi:sugar/nucleoside kinase (ribokinase family)
MSKMPKQLIVVGELHQDLYYENSFYEDLVNKIVDNLINFIRYNPDDLMNRRLLTKIVKSGFSDTSKKILSKSYIKRGGNGNNSAEYLSDLGIPVKLISVIGTESEWMLEELQKKNIDTAGIFKIQEKTPISTIIKSEFTTKIYLAPNLKERMIFKTVSFDNSFFSDAELIYFTPLAEKFKDIFEKAIEQGLIIATTIEYQKVQRSEQLEQLLSQKTDLLFINLNDAKLILEEDNIETIDKKLGNYSQIRIYTDGKKGSYIFTNEISKLFIPTKEVEVIDRTGAGDCYAAGFLTKFYHLVKNKDHLTRLLSSETIDDLILILKECGKYATFTAMFKVSHQNPPTENELEEFISKFAKE